MRVVITSDSVSACCCGSLWCCDCGRHAQFLFNLSLWIYLLFYSVGRFESLSLVQDYLDGRRDDRVEATYRSGLKMAT